MSQARLASEFWIMAGIRQCAQQGVAATVARKGDPRAGAAILKINLLGPGFKVFTQALNAQGVLGWLAAFEGRVVDEAEADAHIARQVKYDPDIWIVEVEHRDGWHPYDGQVF